MQFTSALPTHSPQLKVPSLTLALNSVKISAELLSTPSIIYPFLLIFSFTLYFVSFLKKISKMYFATRLLYTKRQTCKAEAELNMTRKVLFVFKGLNLYIIKDDFTLDRSCVNDSRYC